MHRTPPAPPLGLPLACAALGFALSVLLMPRVPGIGDCAEFTLALALAGVPHPTGYPLYVLLGHGFVVACRALGLSWVTGANLWSAAGAAVATGAYARAAQLVAAGAQVEAPGAPPAPRARWPVIALAPVVLLILNPVWIGAATEAEVYSWLLAWTAAALAFTFGRLGALSAQAPPAGGGAARHDLHAGEDRRAAAFWGLLCGLGAAHHAIFVFFAAPLSAALAVGEVRAGRWRWAHAGIALVAALLPLSSISWIAWRAAHPAPFQWPVEPTAAALWQHVSGAVYTGYVGRFAPRSTDWALIRLAILPWLVPGLLLWAVFALRAQPTLRPGLIAALAGAAALTVFIARYGVPDPATYFAPALMIGLLAAIPLLLWVERRASPALACALAVAAALAVGSWSLPRALAERAHLVAVDARIRAAWRLIPFDRGIVLWNDDHYQRLELFQLLEGERPGLYVDSPQLLAWSARRAAFRRRFDFDPLGGAEIRTREDVSRIPDLVRRSSPLPVVDFPALLAEVPQAR